MRSAGFGTHQPPNKFHHRRPPPPFLGLGGLALEEEPPEEDPRPPPKQPKHFQAKTKGEPIRFPSTDQTQALNSARPKRHFFLSWPNKKQFKPSIK